MPIEIQEVLIQPLADVLARLGEGVAQAQRAMDLNAIATQTLIDNDPVLSETGLQATWYHMPEVTLELRMSLSLRRENDVKAGRVVASRLKLLAAPFNASVQNTQGFDMAGTSLLKARIVAIPPPQRIEGEP
ncbi:hypothetical protein ACQW02_12235 [Humitalea sp. 24SJ18S-53]|uniref:hypothetical protein n=1 Tax=Humitalea sp. 24SJ18S-53 TaxID=3422307 RepID=UPI003D667D68